MATISKDNFDPMPFKTLSDNEFAVMNQDVGNRFSQNDMNRLNQLKFNPFGYNDNIALCDNNTNLDMSLETKNIKCNYYLPSIFADKTAELNNENKFSILHLNIRSIANKFDCFKGLLDSLDMNFKIIGLTETWLNDCTNNIFEMPNYNYTGLNRANKKGGGVGIYVAKQLEYKIRKDLNTNIEDTIETIFIEISVPKGKNIIIGVIYRPPNNKIEIFQNALNAIIEKVGRENKICYFMGDFNIDLLKSESCDYSSRFTEQFFTSCFVPLVTKPTRITSHSASLIDNIFTNKIDKIDKSFNGIIFSDISDHLPIVHICDLDNSNNNSKQTFEKSDNKRILNSENIKTFTNEIKNVSWSSVLTNMHPESAFKEFSKLFTSIYEKNFPFRNKISGRSSFNKIRSPWMTSAILKSIKRKNKLYKTYLTTPNKKNENIYKKYKNKLNHTIKISKKMYYEEQLIKHKHNAKMIWKTMNEILNKREKNKELPETFFDTNSSKQVKDPKAIANKFNEYFTNIGPNLAKKIKKNANTNFEKYLTGNYPNSMFLTPITENEIQSELRMMHSNKSPGYDNINNKIIKLSATEISKPLTHIFNLTFVNGVIPDELKLALVTPIFKAQESDRFENYRPISVLSCFSKLLEKLMYNRLISYIEVNKILSKHQYGFRKNRSTELAIIELVDKITKGIDQGKYTLGIFLDLSKAFDTIHHRILIKKLEHYGIRGICLKWFENYLENRKQVVKYNKIKSDEMTIKSGVPQGSILGPLLFLLYINDIQNCSNIISIILFADDTNVFYSHTSIEKLNEIMQTEINKISDWLNANILSINTTKTKCILFRSRKKKQKQNITITINDNVIKQVKKTTFLGVVIDECLTWKEHINLITKKMIKASSIISRIRHFTNLNALKLIYYSLVYPYLIYGNLIWGNTYKTRLQKIMNIQKKLMRLITFKSYSEHTESIFKKLEILNIYQVNDFLTSLFMFRYFNLKNLPEIFVNYFITNKEVHHHNTRKSSQLHKSYKKTNYVTYTLSSKGVDIWNGLNKKYKDIKSLYIFRKEIKKHLLQIGNN